MKTTTIHISLELKRELKRLAILTDKTMQSHADKALWIYLRHTNRVRKERL